MAKFKVTFKKSVAKDLRALPNKDVGRILKRIEQLAVAPRGEGCIKLAGSEHYRVRQGQYRIVYEIVDHQLVVTVIKVAHRSRVYR